MVRQGQEGNNYLIDVILIVNMVYWMYYCG